MSKYIKAKECPQYPTGVKRTSKLDPYTGVIRKLLAQGCHNAKTIFLDLKQMGFDGSYELKDVVDRQHPVARFCRKVAGRKSERSVVCGSLPPLKEEILPWSASRASWILTKPADQLTADEEAALQRMVDSDTAVAEAHTLGQRFFNMIRQQDASALMPWLSDVAQSGIDAFNRFASGIQQDLVAVTAALSLPWSQGQVEGQVNRLKLIKRQMYGRAKFDLLRKRVLGCPGAG